VGVFIVTAIGAVLVGALGLWSARAAQRAQKPESKQSPAPAGSTTTPPREDKNQPTNEPELTGLARGGRR
jgi:hypothetical protein